MNNIFKSAYFGKAYKTRDGRKAILIQPKTYHVILEDLTEYSVMNNGLAYDDMATSYDIISEWQEPINEKELNRLAEESNPNNPHGDTYEVGQYFGFDDGFKAGYRKAMEGE